MSTSDPVLQLVSAALVLLVPAGVSLVLGRGSRSRAVVLVGVAVVVGGASLILDVVTATRLDLAVSALDAAFAGAVASVVAMLAALRVGVGPGAAFALVWGLIVYLPIVSAVLEGVPSVLQVVLGAVDYAGVLATHAAAASALLVLALLPVRGAPAQTAPGDPVGWSRALTAAALVLIGASAWLLGAERLLTEASGRTLGNAVIGMLLAAVTWIAVEKIALDRVTPSGVVAGVVVGWGAIGAGVPYLSPMALAATAVIGTAAGLGAAARRFAIGGHELRAGAWAALVGMLVGGVIVTLLADGFGLAETGTLTFTIGQVGAVIAVSLVGAVGGAVSALVARALSWWAIPDSN